MSIYIEKLIYIKRVNQIWSLSMYFWSLSINFELFDWIQKRYNQFRRDDSDSDDEIVSKKTIKKRFNFKQILSLSQFNRLSLSFKHLNELSKTKAATCKIALCNLWTLILLNHVVFILSKLKSTSVITPTDSKLCQCVVVYLRGCVIIYSRNQLL